MNSSKVKLYPYHPASESTKLLSVCMGIKRLKHEGSKWNPRGEGKFVINWGCTNSNKFPFDVMAPDQIINHPDIVKIVSDKKKFFEVLSEQGDDDHEFLPAWTANLGTAKSWVADGHTVVCRTILNGHEGVGIVLASTPEELVDAPLFTKYIKKKEEYRVHVIGGEVVDIQQKKKRIGHGGEEYRIRNTANGYVYCRDGIDPPKCVKDVAIKCVTTLGLDFSGVDVIYNAHYDRALVLEVNSAPGIEGTTVQRYSDALTSLIDDTEAF